MHPGYRIRRATTADVAVIARHRVLMFRDMDQQPDETAAEVEAATRAQLEPLLASGGYVGWLVEMTSGAIERAADPLDGIVASPGKVVAGAGLIERLRLPRHSNPGGHPEAYVMNVYTEPAHRRRGLALALMEATVAWCRTRRLGRIALHASAQGRLVYERLGFATTNEMVLTLADRR